MVLKHHALHHIYIITMFHAFRCVFSLLHYCVLVGLNWAEPMLFLILHVTYSCIFMHTYLQFFFLLYCVVGTFLIVFLSFFLSFSPSYISCVMAPKHKSTPSRNSLRSRVSSFFSPSNPTPSHSWFRDEKAKSDFFKNFSQRGIHSKLQVVLSDFSDIDLPLSSTVGVRSHYMASWSRALP